MNVGSSRDEKQPRVAVRQRVDVQISAEETLHALRCWLSHQLAPRLAPEPAQFSDVFVAVQVTDDGELIGATFSYDPKPAAQPQPEHP